MLLTEEGFRAFVLMEQELKSIHEDMRIQSEEISRLEAIEEECDAYCKENPKQPWLFLLGGFLLGVALEKM